MEDLEFITEENVKKTIENFSIEELVDNKKKLVGYIHHIDLVISTKRKQKKEADKYFK